MPQLIPLIVIGGGFAFVGAMLCAAWLLGRYHGREETLPFEFADVQTRMHRLEQVLVQTTSALDRLEARAPDQRADAQRDAAERRTTARPVRDATLEGSAREAVAG